MNWLILALITAFFYAAYNIFIKLSSHHIHEITGAFILQIAAMCLGFVAWSYLKFKGQALHFTSKGIALAILAGIFAGIAEILSFYIFSLGVPASRVVPVIIGGTIAITAIVGLFFLKETLHIKEYMGVLFIILGIILITSSAP